MYQLMHMGSKRVYEGVEADRAENQRVLENNIRGGIEGAFFTEEATGWLSKKGRGHVIGNVLTALLTDDEKRDLVKTMGL
jgi:hypothetical protein